MNLNGAKNGHALELQEFWTDTLDVTAPTKKSPLRRLPEKYRPEPGECAACRFKQVCDGSAVIKNMGGFHACPNRLSYEAEHPLMYDAESQTLLEPEDGPYIERPPPKD